MHSGPSPRNPSNFARFAALPRALRRPELAFCWAFWLSAACEPAPGAKPAPAPSANVVKADRARPSFLRGPTDGAPIAPFVKAQLATANQRGNAERVVVYVGATWCEPCQYFHAAVEGGKLDQELAGVRFIEFDLDVDRDALAEAGYASPMLPLFVVPGADGRGTERRFAGSIKGPGAVQNLTPRLARLLANQPVQ